MSTVFVSKAGQRVAGYYALATGGVEQTFAPPRVVKGIGKYPVPVIVLARLAVDRQDQGDGLGRAILADALRRVEAAAEEIGIRALLIHAKNQTALDFYMRHGEFEPSPTDPLHLFLLMKDLRKALNP
jgi:GNAT superfamily N-acetyltransferase